MDGEKLANLRDAVASITDGQTLAIGGSMAMAPMAIVREIIRQGKKDLNIICLPVGGMNVDILIGAGLVKSIRFGQVVFEEFGSAPNFRRMAESGMLVCKDTP